MASDTQYSKVNYRSSEMEHKYGQNVHILADPLSQTILAKLSRPDAYQPLLNKYIEELYRSLFASVVNSVFPREEVKWETRMKEFVPEGVFGGEVLKESAKAVVVNLARAGTFPSHVCFNELNYFLKPEGLRQDHFYVNRKTNDAGEVVGVDVSGSKIGGGVDDAYVLFPDPMGATGGSISHCISHYKEAVPGKAAKYIAMHVIVTPEYIKRMTTDHPDVEIFSLRLDRGLSDSDVLATTPGTHWDKERGLTDTQYIVPGAGGVGEILNNSFV